MNLIHHGLSFFYRKYRQFVSKLIVLFTNIDQNKIIFWADNFKHYGCNPKYISEEIAKHTDYEIIWAFDKKFDFQQNLPYKLVKFGSLKYLYHINTAKFIVTNQLIDESFVIWKKRVGQILIMTWHGTFPLKRIMGDVRQDAPFINRMTKESNKCDLILSDSNWFSNLLRRSFWYRGEILNKGIPRNDVFYNVKLKKEAAKKVRSYYNLADDTKVVLYAPTFRNNHDRTPYIYDWQVIYEAFEKRYSEPISILIRLHPNMIGTKESNSILNNRHNVISVTDYDDMQELLCVADVLITDYSTSMFDISLASKPCLLYTPDYNTYDRGTYFNLNSLPFPIAYNIQDLISNIIHFNEEDIVNNQTAFLNEVFNPIINPRASFEVVKWILSK